MHASGKTVKDKASLDRRGFLKKTAVSASWAVLAAQQGAAESIAPRPDRYGVLADMNRCIGCRRCEASCAAANHLPAPQFPSVSQSIFEKPRKLDAQTYTVVNRYEDKERSGAPVYRKAQCMHCDEPACAAACLVGALKKMPEGPVLWDEHRCIGCRYCMNACPFYVPAYEYANAFTPKIRKCFMCYHQRIVQGEKPACVSVCPVDALAFGKRTDVLQAARERIRKHSGSYVDSIYGEHEAGGTSWLYIGPMAFAKTGLPDDIGSTPPASHARDFLALVPLVLTVWPPLLGAAHLLCRRNKTDKINPEVTEKDPSSS